MVAICKFPDGAAALVQSVPSEVRTLPEAPGATELKLLDAPPVITLCCVIEFPVNPPAPSAVTTPVTFKFKLLFMAIKASF